MFRWRGFWLFYLLALSVVVEPLAPAQGNEFFMYFGTYTGFKFVSQSLTHGVGNSHSEGIYVSRFDADTGAMGAPELAARIVNPAFLVISPNHKFLYAITEDPLSVGPPFDHSSYVTAFAIDSATGKLRFINSLPTGGTSTCFLSMDKTGKFVFFANFGSGSVSVLRVKDDGSLGEQTAFMQHVGHGGSNLPVQTSPHPHSVMVSPDNRYLIVSDLGMDRVLVYHFNENTGALSPLDPPSIRVKDGAGPRHLIFDHQGKFAYQVNEMGSTISAFAWNASEGTLSTLQETKITSGEPDVRSGSAELQLSNDGKFLYESNRLSRDYDRLPGTIGIYAVDPAKGILTELEYSPSGGTMPRSFGIDPTGRYLFALHQLSNNVVQFKVDLATGKISRTGKEIKVDTPVCIQFVLAH